MTAIEKLLNSESFIRMVSTVCFWIVLYVVVRLFSYRAGVNNLLKYGYRRIQNLSKAVSKLNGVCSASSPTISGSVKAFDNVLKLEKKASKVLNMYLFDDKNDTDVKEDKAIIDAVPDKCRDIIKRLAESNGTEVFTESFNDIDADLNRALVLLKKADALDRQKELLRI